MKLSLVVILFVLFASPSFAQKSDSDILITIERRGCLGSCPIYSAQIYTNGTVIYKGVSFVKVTGEKRYQIPTARIPLLLEAFEKADYFTFKDEYFSDENGVSMSDLPTTITSILLNGKKKQVINYYGAPQKLKELENRIEFLADLDENIIPL